MARVGDPTSPPRDVQALVHDRTAVVITAVLLLIAGAAWIDVIRTSLGTPDMMMTMFMPITASDGIAFTVGWAVMMAAMMLSSATPMIALYGATQRREGGPASRAARVAVFTLVYLAVWGASGVPVYLAHTGLMALPPRAFAYRIAAVLVSAGVFQLSPLKRACLRACRSPLGFLLGHWRPGPWGGLALGWAHAVYCLGCCWALMVVLVAAGAMGLPWVLGITAVVAMEKLLPRGEWIARATGGAFLILGMAAAAYPDLVNLLRGAHAM